MFDHSFAFDSSLWLALLALLPVLWALSYRGLSGLGPWRRIWALALRSLVFAAIVFALADTQYRKKSDRLTVIYLLDQSLSIPEAQRDAMKAFVNASVREHRRDDKQDRAGVIVFGREAEVELPPVDFNYQMPRLESTIDRQQTNLEAALGRAMSLFPHDSAKRVVIVTDGNENVGDALRTARAMTDSGVSIDEESDRMFLFVPGTNLNEIVQAVNEVGAAPGDLVAILEALKQAGALRAELLVI